MTAARRPSVGALAWVACTVVCAIGALVLLWPMVAMVVALMAPPVAPPVPPPVLELPLGSIGDGAPAASASADPIPWTAYVWSFAMSGAAGLVGAAAAWPASRALRRARFVSMDAGGRAAALLALAVLLPMVLPPWLLYAAGWMNCGPGTIVGDLFERADAMPILRFGLLSLALVTWSAAGAFAVLLVAAPERVGRDRQLIALDGRGWVTRLRSAVARDARCLALAACSSTVFLLCETTVFDLAQVPTVGFELRSLDALGGTTPELLRAAWPLIAVAVCGAVALPRFARGLGDDGLRSRGSASVDGRSGAWVRPSLVLLALPTVVLVLALLRIELAVPRGGDFLALHGRALVHTVAVAAASALVVGILAASLRVMLDGRARWVWWFARVAAIGMLAFGVLPATVTAVAFAGAYNTSMLAPVYDSPLIVVLVLVARAAPVAALVALALAAREPASSRRLRELDGVTPAAAWRGIRSEVALASGSAAALAFAWSLGELTASGRVVPPGFAWLATDVLNAIHYQRPETVVLATLAIVGAAVPALWMLGRLLRRMKAPGAAMGLAAVAALGLVSIPGCGDGRGGASAPGGSLGEPGGGSGGGSDDERLMSALRAASPEVEDLLAVDQSIEGVGRGKGQFNGPRVLAVDQASGDAYVIDKDARVQRFSSAGEQLAEWRMPKRDRGKPVGASVAPDGTLVVIDTHEHRVVCYTPDGTLQWTLGEYGTGPGQFIYPTDVVFLADGRMLVAEYGGNDRIQAFGRDRRVMYQFGRSGTETGEFLRPQALAYDAERDELYVVDSGNHRVQVFTADGEFRRAIGRPGPGQGELNYPFGIVLLIGGRAIDALGQAAPGVDASSSPRTVVLCEHGNHRVQALDGGSGQSLAIAGGIGREHGRLKYPWAIEPAGIGAGGVQRFAVCDHGNSRIEYCTIPMR